MERHVYPRTVVSGVKQRSLTHLMLIVMLFIEALSKWKIDGIKAVWITVRTRDSDVISVCTKVSMWQWIKFIGSWVEAEAIVIILMCPLLDDTSLFILQLYIKLRWLDNFLHVSCYWPKYSFSGTGFTCYLLSFQKLVLNTVHFLLTKNIKRGNKGIIVYIYIYIYIIRF